MSLLFTLKNVFALGLFSNICSSESCEVINQNVRGFLRDDEKSFAYANFVMHRFYYLNITPLIGMSVYRSEDCGMSCLEHVSCLSFNVAAFRDMKEQKTLCELLPSDKYSKSNRFSPSQQYHHFSIMTPCLNKPCKNDAPCLAQYEQNSFRCDCETGFVGKLCETGAV
ncbi:PREDICTED: uncharacterized protein LOC107342174 [Acropora digitifera]|uniref:uncharacterized protein LOC107342174 n=1 Tax=Acropora digitifera TaxID=70779 RepID=UPI00077B19E8|nr:PREDICTED: uncharacterized protein LOC107342174 [Acropora digitifera]